VDINRALESKNKMQEFNYINLVFEYFKAYRIEY